MKVTLDIPKAELAKLINPAIIEPRIPLSGVTWQHYETLIATLSPLENLYRLFPPFLLSRENLL